jgi:tryptophan 2,3-dioxygenase
MIHDHHEHQAAFRSYDGTFSYTGPTGHEGHCYLQVFERRGALPVVLACETNDNPGASVTNAAASIATQAWRRLLPQAKEGIVFVEAYVDPHHVHIAPGERFAEVTFDLDGDALHSPRWRHRERAEVERLIGGPISLPVESSS